MIAGTEQDPDELLLEELWSKLTGAIDGDRFRELVFESVNGLSKPAMQLRAPRRVKRLVEELWPLATFLGSERVPGQRVRVSWQGDRAVPDAIVEVNQHFAGTSPHTFRTGIELTSVAPENDHLYREALHRYGHVPFDPEIKREGSKRKGNDQIIAAPVAARETEFIEPMFQRIVERAHDKQSGGYPEGTVILVGCFFAIRPRTADWLKLIERLEATTESWSHSVVAVVPTDGLILALIDVKHP